MGSRCNSRAWEKLPKEELAAFDRRLHVEPMRIEHLLWLTGGFSGSPVALVRVERTGRAPAEEILKFCKEGENERQRISSAYGNASKRFRKAHMVKPRGDFFQLHEWTAVFLEIAGGDLSSYKRVAEFADKQELADICAVVITSLLGEWNAGSVRRNNDIGVGGFLEKVIGADRLTSTSKLATFASEAQIRWDERWITREDQPDRLLNPLILTDSTADMKVNAIIGYGHGDLSVHNVLVPTLPEFNADGFLLIDYGTFSYEYPLARDPMYLLVSLATQWLKDIRLPSSRSRALAREVARAGPPTPDLGLADYRKVINTIFETGRKWAASQALGRHWLPQSFLALVGSALTFIGRDIPDLESAAVNDWLFDLAAVVVKEHLVSYALAGGASPEPVSHVIPYDLTPHTGPVSRANPAPPTVASAVNMSQAGAGPATEPPAEGNGAYDDRPDPLATLLESAMGQLREKLAAVGLPPAPPSRGGGVGRWLVSLGYWTDGADSVLSKIVSFTYANCNDPPDRFAQAVDDAQSALRKVVDRLPTDPTVIKDVTALAAWAADFWRQMVQLLPLSMEACGLGHVLLAADDQMIATASPGALPRPSGIPADPGLETLMVKLIDTRSRLEPVVDRFLRQRPSDDAADLLLDWLDALFKLLDRTYLTQSEGGQRVNLERIHNAARPAAIALSRLTGSALSNDELSSIHEDLSRLLRVLDDFLPINDSRGGQ